MKVHWRLNVKHNKAFHRELSDGEVFYVPVSTGVKGLFKGRSQLFNGCYSLDMIHTDRQSAVAPE